MTMQSAIADIMANTSAGSSQTSHWVRQHVTKLAPGGNIPTFEKAVEIVKTILKDNHRGDTPQGTIAYVFRIHLFSLAHKEGLSLKPFQNKNISVQQICFALSSSAGKCPSARRKLEKICSFLKLQNIQSFIDEIAAQNGRSTHSEPPITLRRAPIHRKRKITFSYA